jgi:non-canonical purine NTP pyrophosphatase (RdgB/HAM1 family)
VPDSAPLLFVSSNPNKWIEAARILGIPLQQVPMDLVEIQAPAIEDITRHKLEQARVKGYDRLIVEDVSLGFDELGGFPGPYIRWLMEAAGGDGLVAVAAALPSRSALACCCVAYWDGEAEHVFRGETAGQVVATPRGPQKFGWDSWFQPEGSSKTFGEMSPDEKDLISHRGRPTVSWQRTSGGECPRRGTTLTILCDTRTQPTAGPFRISHQGARP